MISEAAKKRARELTPSHADIPCSALDALEQYIDEVSAVAKYIAKLNQGTDCPVLGAGRLEKFILPDEPDVLIEAMRVAWHAASMGCDDPLAVRTAALREQLAKHGLEIREKARD